MKIKSAFLFVLAAVFLCANAAYPVSESQEKIWQGDKYMEKKQYELAVKEYKQAVRLNPESEEGYYKLGTAYFELAYKNSDYAASTEDRFTDARDCFKKVIELNPMNMEAYNDIGASYGVLGHHKEAIPYFERAIKVNPEDVNAYSNIGAAYNSLHQPDKAIPYLEKAIEVNPEFWKSYKNLGDSYYYKGNNRKAKEYYIKAKELMGDAGYDVDRKIIDQHIKKMH
jgi:tetratricopeptide (TPR) repeat protein